MESQSTSFFKRVQVNGRKADFDSDRWVVELELASTTGFPPTHPVPLMHSVSNSFSLLNHLYLHLRSPSSKMDSTTTIPENKSNTSSLKRKEPGTESTQPKDSALPSRITKRSKVTLSEKTSRVTRGTQIPKADGMFI